MASAVCFLFVFVCAFAAQALSISGHDFIHIDDLRNNRLGFRTTIKHIDAGKNLTRSELIKRAVERGNFRNKCRQSGTSLVKPGSFEYLMNVGMGTPTKYFSLVMDTGSDLNWVKCGISTQEQTFNPANSSSYNTDVSCSSKFCNALPESYCSDDICNYSYGYGDGSGSIGILAKETITFGTSKKGRCTRVKNVTFGCADDWPGFKGDINGEGLIGLGRGTLSLISQLQEPQFSYCLTPLLESETSSLFLGSYALFLPRGPVRKTPIVRNPSDSTSYYISILGIIIGRKRLDIPPETFALNPDGSGGVLVDSGTTLFYMPDSAYDLVEKELTELIKLEQYIPHNKTETAGLKPCWTIPSSGKYSFPKFILHLNGTYIELFTENYLYEAIPGVQCLAIAPSHGSLSIFGNVAQQGYLVRYDLAREEYTFVPTNCKGI
ncbi:Aspartic proteinase nepenthesin-2-like protein [Drosera capensis]